MSLSQKRHMPQPNQNGRFIVFAYGSNLHVPQMRRRAPSARPLCAAALPNHTLVFRGVADVAHAKNRQVHGALWSCTASDLAALDRYEGYPYLYDRKLLKVESQYGTTEALVYSMNEGGQELPSAGYLSCLREGYAAFGLPEAALVDAIKRVKKWQDRRAKRRVEADLAKLPGSWSSPADRYVPIGAEPKQAKHRWALGADGAYRVNDTPVVTSAMSPATRAEAQLTLDTLAKKQVADRAYDPKRAQSLWEQAVRMGYVDEGGALIPEGVEWLNTALSKQVNHATLSKEDWVLIDNPSDIEAMAMEDDAIARSVSPEEQDWEDVNVEGKWVRVYDNGTMRVLDS